MRSAAQVREALGDAEERAAKEKAKRQRAEEEQKVGLAQGSGLASRNLCVCLPLDGLPLAA